ncbi:hypothetical protein V1517DRAFT_334410 [Lipomyces orientalis]|uniref:Uncharacterized protein n=1 Tax=Lipomyces orientalis TaxID=1233043 RepID=A0ACC3TCF6_9ASCO
MIEWIVVVLILTFFPSVAGTFRSLFSRRSVEEQGDRNHEGPVTIPARSMDCPLCPRSFSAASQLRRHITGVHHRTVAPGQLGRPGK